MPYNDRQTDLVVINGQRTAAEGAGGGVFPDDTLEKEPLLSEADRDIIGFEEVDAIRYY